MRRRGAPEPAKEPLCAPRHGGKTRIGAIDIGSSGLRVLVLDSGLNELGRAYQHLRPLQPAPDRSELDAEELFEQVRQTFLEACRAAKTEPSEIASIGISCFRASVVSWNRHTGKPLHHLISWQDTRTKSYCESWNNGILLTGVRGATGLLHWLTGSDRLRVLSQFKFEQIHGSIRIAWVLQHVPGAMEQARRGDLLVGTLDTWLLWKLTGGRIHATDFSAASSTGLYDFFVMDWSQIMLRLLGIPTTILPEVRDTAGDFGCTDPAVFGVPIPIGASVADQQASLFGHGCFERGDVKLTLGTGGFLNLNVGDRPYGGNLTCKPMVAWKIGDTIRFTAEAHAGNIGPLLDWGRQFGLYQQPQEIDDMAMTTSTSGSLCIVPAFFGLHVPWDDQYARTLAIGIDRETTRERLVRAMAESIGFLCYTIFDAMYSEFPLPPVLRIDGGVSQSDFVAQQLATLSNVAVERPANIDSTALGVGMLAGLGVGLFATPESIFARVSKLGRRFHPAADEAAAENRAAAAAVGPRDEQLRTFARWNRAIPRAYGWHEPPEGAARPLPIGIIFFSLLALVLLGWLAWQLGLAFSSP